MSLDSNTWYSIQSFGTDFYLAANAPSNGSGGITVSSSATVNSALWQAIAPDNNSPTDILRTEQYGNNYNGSSYCMTASGLVSPSQQVCGTDSGVWNLQYFNGNDAQDGWLISNGWPDITRRLYTDPITNDLSMRTYSSGNSSDDIYYQWAIQSVSAINDQAWSTVALSSSTPATSTSNSTSASSTPTSTVISSNTTSPTIIISLSTPAISSPSPTTTEPIVSNTSTDLLPTDTSSILPPSSTLIISTTDTPTSTPSIQSTIISSSSPPSSSSSSSLQSPPSASLQPQPSPQSPLSSSAATTTASTPEGLTSTNYITVQPSPPTGTGTRSISTAIVTVPAASNTSPSGSAIPSTGSSGAATLSSSILLKGEIGMLKFLLSMSMLMTGVLAGGEGGGGGMWLF